MKHYLLPVIYCLFNAKFLNHFVITDGVKEFMNSLWRSYFCLVMLWLFKCQKRSLFANVSLSHTLLSNGRRIYSGVLLAPFMYKCNTIDFMFIFHLSTSCHLLEMLYYICQRFSWKESLPLQVQFNAVHDEMHM